MTSGFVGQSWWKEQQRRCISGEEKHKQTNKHRRTAHKTSYQVHSSPAEAVLKPLSAFSSHTVHCQALLAVQALTPVTGCFSVPKCKWFLSSLSPQQQAKVTPTTDERKKMTLSVCYGSLLNLQPGASGGRELPRCFLSKRL